MSSLKKGQKNIEKEELLQAVVVVDDFEGIFSDFTRDGSSALLPVANVKLVDYALECLGRCGVQEAIIFCSSHANVIKENLKNSPWSHPSSTMHVTILVSEKCQSLGDALRDIDNKALIKGDFILLSAFTISNLNLVNILNYHRQMKLKDKGTAMTLILQDVGSINSQLDISTFVVNAITSRLLMHVKCSNSKKFKIPLEQLLGNASINILNNLIDTGIAICSPSVPILFSDNFDFQTKNDFIRGLLLNEEIIDSRIYCYQVENGYGITCKNWKTYQKMNIDCIHRWTFPLVPDQYFTKEKPFSFYRHCIYKQADVHMDISVNLEMDVVIGSNSQIGLNTTILRSVIGKNCYVGKNVVIRDSYLLDNCIVEDNCKIELCVIGENTKVNENSKLYKCLIKKNVLLHAKSQLGNVLIVRETNDKNWEKINENAYCLNIKSNQFGSCENMYQYSEFELLDPEADYTEANEGEVSSSSECDRSDIQSPEPDDLTLFYTEVVDSLHRGFEEKLSCENLILEINSSRYAYNVTLADVTVLTLKGILLLPSRVTSTPKAVLSYFLPLLKNYVKTFDAQMDCLDLFEEIFSELGNEVAKCLHYLYDNDIISEDTILEWYNSLEKNSPIVKKVAPLIKWLNEAAEESSEEDN